MIIFKQAKEKNLSKQTWSGARVEDRRTATIMCPEGHIGSISNHTIDDQGVVNPSVVCPWEGCDFHDFIQLEGWERLDK